jgi:hypothetical protein
LVWGGWTGSRH